MARATASTLLVLGVSLLCSQSHAASSLDRKQLESQLQQIIDKHSHFWNASMSFAIYNDTVEAAVASGRNNYADPHSKLTPNVSIPMGSTTKMYSAVAVLRLVSQGVIALDQPIAPLVDKYLAQELPCAQTPAWCSPTCWPIAHCLDPSTVNASCASVTRDTRAQCSYCLRYVHCCDSPSCPSKVTLKGIWGSETIERVTFHHLIGMQSGVQDYYLDSSNWLMQQVLASTRDVEPLEYLMHMNKTFLFEPGCGRASYSTNGFSLVGLALSGLFNLTDWAQLDQRELAWGDQLFPDDQTLFPTRGTCSQDPRIARQYTTAGDNKTFVDVTDHSCLNNWLGGNIAARPLDVARFTHHTFTKKLLDEAAFVNMTQHLHEITDGFAVGYLAYGLGLEAQWNGGKPTPTKTCGMDALGHAGVDYGSASSLAAYIPDMKLGVSFAMDTAGLLLPTAVGMNCSLRYSSLSRAPQMAMNELINTVMKEVVGIEPSCPIENYDILPAASCQDAPSFGRIDLKQLTCAAFLDATLKSVGKNVSAGQICDGILNVNTLTQLKSLFWKSHAWYMPPSGYDPDKTLGVELCKGTCGAAGSGPCWLSGAIQPWCTPVSETPIAQASTIMI